MTKPKPHERIHFQARETDVVYRSPDKKRISLRGIVGFTGPLPVKDVKDLTVCGCLQVKHFTTKLDTLTCPTCITYYLKFIG
jgi:hypothetical protein